MRRQDNSSWSKRLSTIKSFMSHMITQIKSYVSYMITREMSWPHYNDYNIFTAWKKYKDKYRIEAHNPNPGCFSRRSLTYYLIVD